jgi:hypothetical protein
VASVYGEKQEGCLLLTEKRPARSPIVSQVTSMYDVPELLPDISDALANFQASHDYIEMACIPSFLGGGS